MTEATRTENTTEERSCRLCGRPAGRVHYFDEDEGLCPEHNRVRRAGDEVDDWESAYTELTERIAPVLDPHHTSHLERVVEPAIEDAKAGLARAYGELELAKRVAEHRPGTPIEEEAHRLLIRADRLREAYEAIDLVPADTLGRGERWGILAALLEARERAEAELAEFKQEHGLS